MIAVIIFCVVFPRVIRTRKFRDHALPTPAALSRHGRPV